MQKHAVVLLKIPVSYEFANKTATDCKEYFRDQVDGKDWYFDLDPFQDYTVPNPRYHGTSP